MNDSSEIYEKFKFILNRFNTYNISQNGLQQLNISRANFKEMAGYILSVTSESREQSLALTALQESKFWTNEAISMNNIISFDMDK